MDLTRTHATLDWLVVGAEAAEGDLGEGPANAGLAVSRVALWSDAVRHLVAYSRVRALVLCSGSDTEIGRMERQARAMQPGIRVYLPAGSTSALDHLPRAALDDLPGLCLP